MNWKAPPPREGMLWVNKSMELQILLACNWACQACDQLSNFSGVSFIRKATMTLAQIDAFCAEMVTKNAYLGRIRLLGGEPTLHPKFEDVLSTLHEKLVRAGHVGRLEVITNGSKPLAPFVKSVSRVRVSDESDKQKHHVANLVATPAELGYEGRMCNSPWHCGFSLNYYGYFPCSAGAGIARMRDWMVWQRLELPVAGVRETWPDLQQLCNRCYHGLRPEDKHKCGTVASSSNAPSADAWNHLGPWLNGKKAEWKVYGSNNCDMLPGRPAAPF